MAETVNQPSALPNRKVIAAGVGGALVSVIVWGAGLVGFEVAPEVAMSLVTVGAAVFGYMVPEWAPQ